MPVEVIDLLSSSSPPQPRAAGNHREPFTAAPKTNILKQALTFERPKQGGDDWFTLLSDSEPDELGKSGSKAASKRPLTASNRENAPLYRNEDAIEMEGRPVKKRRLSPVVSRVKEVGLKGLRKTAVREEDPIVFTSSPDPFADVGRRRRRREERNEGEDIVGLEKTKNDKWANAVEVLGDSDEDDIFGFRKPVREKRDKMEEVLGESDDDDIFGLRPPAKERGGKKPDTYDISDGPSDMELPDLDEIPGSLPMESFKQSSQAALKSYNAERAKEKKAKEAAQKTGEKQAAKEARLAAKEAEKERKRLEKEEKANEKERQAELARVNIARTNKQKTSPEMIVDLPSTFSDSALGEQVLKLLGKAEIKHSSWESSLPIIKWRREVTCEYNEEIGQWEPVPMHVKTESHVMFVMSTKEFVELATEEAGNDIDAHILGLKAKFPNRKIVYLIEGLGLWMRKNKTIQNRKYIDTVRNAIQDEPARSQRARKKKEETYVDEDLVEDALLRLQVMHGALIHHTAVMVETAEWILVFTQHISTIPYR